MSENKENDVSENADAGANGAAETPTCEAPPYVPGYGACDWDARLMAAILNEWNKSEAAASGPSVTMPDGQRLILCEWARAPLFGACMVNPGGNMPDTLEVFTAGRGSPIPGSVSVPMMRHHTNLLKSGDNGLPLDYEMIVSKMSGKCSERLAEPVMRLFDTIYVNFEYNCKKYTENRLSDLMLGEVVLNPLPIHMRENCAYKVNLMFQRRDAWDDWCEYMTTVSTKVRPQWDRMIAKIEQYACTLRTSGLDTPLGRLVPKASIDHAVDGLMDVASNLSRSVYTETTTRPMTIWIYLDGMIKRSVC